ncbi:MAG: hypothetical protein LBP94_01555 [Zoogloeaceae bacterium]|jgi:hypothetical protein|nr:hypothetical protein [Zoogloeaceae bacterium]
MNKGRFFFPVMLILAFAFALPHSAFAQAPTNQPAAAKPAQIDRNSMLMMIRSTLLALDHANKTGNYTVLRDIGSPAFQNNTAARLSEIFTKQRNERLNLTGVAVLEPKMTVPPQIDANGMMRMSGVFQIEPSPLKFDLLFVAEGGQWRLFGLGVDTGPIPAPPGRPGAKEQPNSAR